MVWVNAPLHRVAVVGAGAVGSFYGAMLARAGHPRHADRPRRRTCRRSSATACSCEMAGRVETVRIAASADLAAVHGADLVLFCVKSTDTEAVARADGAAPGRRRARAEPAERRRQRGDDRAAACRSRVVPAVVYVATAMPEPGVVQHYGRGDLVIGAMPRGRSADAAPWPTLQALVDLLRQRAGAGAHLAPT